MNAKVLRETPVSSAIQAVLGRPRPPHFFASGVATVDLTGWQKNVFGCAPDNKDMDKGSHLKRQ
jgi:hypothetical protein